MVIERYKNKNFKTTNQRASYKDARGKAYSSTTGTTFILLSCY
ncbi:hypothetical protein PROFFT_A_06170 [Candidatus Profftia tarda]|uniref:Uncharacterized protein n=1 Tax=Candidatus Profftia tarda TaxID=1177216 RepID=A0A8E4GHZ4_9ENTR|nr:hypothetical protein PROFFT_A_06170 [Candidatus Profftia tarda]